MIFVVSGTVGTGKSQYMANVIRVHLLRGGVVATNMRIHLSEIERLFHRRLYPWQLVTISAGDEPRKIPRGDFRGTAHARKVLVVLDEALNWFASSQSAKDERKLTWGEWLRQSDKLGQDVYFIAQDFGRAAKWIRELAQVAIHIRALKHLSIFRVPFGRLPGLRNLYGVTKYDVATQNVLSWSLHFYDPRIFKCYETAELYGFDASENAYLGTVPPPFRVPFWPFVFPVGVIVWGCVYAARSAA